MSFSRWTTVNCSRSDWVSVTIDNGKFRCCNTVGLKFEKCDLKILNQYQLLNDLWIKNHF